MAKNNSTEITEDAIEKAVIGITKAQNFTFLIYPDSAPEGWEEKLEQLGQPMAISPLHDKDKAKTGGFKKPHYHVIYRANNNVTADSVRKKIQRKLGVKAVAMVQIADNIESLWWYLSHESKDAIAKKKHVYDRKDIVLLNNFDIERYIVFDVEELGERFEALCELIMEHELANMIQLMKFIKENGSKYGFTSHRLVRKIIEPRTSMLRLYFDGVYQEKQNKKEQEKALLVQKFMEIPVAKNCKKSSYPPAERGECIEKCVCFAEEDNPEN